MDRDRIMNFVRSIVVAVALAFSSASTVSAQDFEKGLAAYNKFDFATAVKEWKPLAEQGHVQAQKYLGGIFEWGHGGFKDHNAAAMWYQLAAEQGDAEAQNSIGYMYSKGFGVSRNGKEAVRWYRMSAEQGYAPAHFNLGYCYDKGVAVLQDNVRAHMWYNINAANGGLGGQNRDIVAKRMTAADISQAQAMARECMGSGYKNCGW